MGVLVDMHADRCPFDSHSFLLVELIVSVSPRCDNDHVNRLSTEKRAQIIGCLCEGMSIRATVRTTGAAKNTIVKLLAELGTECAAFMDVTFRNLDVQRVEADEIWSFCYAKAKNVPEDFIG